MSEETATGTESGGQIWPPRIFVAIAKYFTREYTGMGEFCTGLVNLSLPNLMRPADPLQDDLIAIELWKLGITEYRMMLEERQCNMEKVYELILGQCVPTIHDPGEASSEWDDINGKSDAIRLLSLIQQCLYQRATRHKPTHALIEAEMALLRFRQGEPMSNSQYLEKLSELVKVYEHLGGEPGSQVGRIEALLTDPDTDNENPLAEAKSKAREEYTAVLLLVKSDSKRYGHLIADIENQFTCGQDKCSI